MRQQWRTTTAAVATASSFNGPTHKQASIRTNPNINESMKHLKLQTQVLKLYIWIQLSIQSWDPGSPRGDHHGSSLLENPYIPYQYMDSYLSSISLGSASMGK